MILLNVCTVMKVLPQSPKNKLILTPLVLEVRITL